jgi:hypothetical protein
MSKIYRIGENTPRPSPPPNNQGIFIALVALVVVLTVVVVFLGVLVVRGGDSAQRAVPAGSQAKAVQVSGLPQPAPQVNTPAGLRGVSAPAQQPASYPTAQVSHPASTPPVIARGGAQPSLRPQAATPGSNANMAPPHSGFPSSPAQYPSSPAYPASPSYAAAPSPNANPAAQGIPPGNQVVAEPATVTGTITYYFNKNYGNKPDVGSKVFLLSGIHPNVIIDRNKDLHFAITIRKTNVVKETSVDGNGNFRIERVAPGQYTVLVISNHTRFPATDGQRPTGYGEMSILGGCYQKSITLNAGDTVDCSNDFGTTYF